tara:strand:- start:54 stop:710 length:657 start_codon:yes stop_codon:yes gene_type:complete
MKNIDLLTYDCPHRKTSDILFELIVNGYNINRVYAAPLIDLGLKPDIVKMSANACYNIHTAEICAKFKIPYIVKPHADIEGGNLGIIGGARILPDHVIQKYSIGIINIHPGLLPNNRGLDNIKWALYHDMPQGLTVHFIDKYVDRGQIILKKKVPVYDDDKIYHIHQRLVSMQPKVLIDALNILERGGETYPAEKGTLFTQMTIKEETNLIKKCSDLF